MSYQYRSAYMGGEFPLPIVPSGQPASHRPYRRWVKRLLDVVIVVMASVPVVLTVALLSVLVALDGSNPFYAQDRVGRNGRVFRMWKLRTMVTGADSVLEQHLALSPDLRTEWDRHQKLARDPRITAIGRILRETSLDELPQLFNVLKGDMSIVGPRPMMTSQRALYPGTEYYNMRPGITGFWQVSARNTSSFHQRADYDRSYYDAMSLGTDVTVIIRTFGVVMKATGH